MDNEQKAIGEDVVGNDVAVQEGGFDAFLEDAESAGQAFNSVAGNIAEGFRALFGARPAGTVGGVPAPAQQQSSAGLLVIAAAVAVAGGMLYRGRR